MTNGKKRLIIFASVIWLATSVGAFSISLDVGRRTMLISAELSLQDIQADLLFNRIEDERHLAGLKKKGCEEAASDFAYHVADDDMWLMHSFVVGGKIDSHELSSIKARDPEVLKEATEYPPGFRNGWEEKACN
jgi:hypothetical protein